MRLAKGFFLLLLAAGRPASVAWLRRTTKPQMNTRRNEKTLRDGKGKSNALGRFGEYFQEGTSMERGCVRGLVSANHKKTNEHKEKISCAAAANLQTETLLHVTWQTLTCRNNENARDLSVSVGSQRMRPVKNERHVGNRGQWNTTFRTSFETYWEEVSSTPLRPGQP